VAGIAFSRCIVLGSHYLDGPHTMSSTDIRTWARRYRDRGLAVCRIKRGEKRPTYKEWNRYSKEPEDFRGGHNIGLQAGRLSGDIVCVDLDSQEALQHADRFLPPTGMTEGRPGKPESHRWYRLTNIPAELSARPGVAGDIGGPRNQPFNGPTGSRVLDFIGTGLQAVVPPSLWTSKDGTQHERRGWHRFDEPKVIDCRELYDCVCRLATASGWRKKETAPSARAQPSRGRATTLPMPVGEAVRQARTFLGGVPPSVMTYGGNHRTFYAAVVLVVEFGLSPEEALPVLLEWNERCSPPWTAEELMHKLEAADQRDGERGWRVRPSSRSILVHVRPEDQDVFVGMDAAAAGEDQSYVSLYPSLWAGMVKVGCRWRLAAELAAINWEGRHVLLTPASTVVTNKRETWDEYHLAQLLRELGADVQGLLLPPLDGRRRTLAMADGADWEVTELPRTPREAEATAGESGRRARELDRYRRSLPRKRSSPRQDAAADFIRTHNVTALTKDVLRRARRRGISKDSLRRALGRRTPPPLCNAPPPSSPL
jgi:hypothetical protein